MKPWPILAAGLVAGVLLTWFLAPRPGPDTHALDALRDSVAVARAQATRDSARLAAVDDSLRAAREHADSVARASHAVVTAARQEAASAHRDAAGASAQVRAVLDSLGASTAALDSLTAAHAREIAAQAEQVAAQAAELVARDRERAILYRRVEASDSLVGSLRGQIARHEAVDAEEARIRAALQGQLRGAHIRERIAEGTAVLAIVVAAVR